MEERHQVRIKSGDWEDIKRRNELSNIALSNNGTVWKKIWKTKLKTRLCLYESSVKSIPNYKFGTWRLSQSDSKVVDSAYSI